MEYFLTYLKVFAVGGLVCAIGQILINKTKMTSARVLVTFLLAGAALEAVGLFKYIEEFGKAGITIPITGFGKSLAAGAIEGAKQGLYQACTGGLAAVAAGLSAAIAFGFVIALVSKSRPKGA